MVSSRRRSDQIQTPPLIPRRHIGFLTLAEDIAVLPPQIAKFDATLLPPRGFSIHYRPSQTGIAEILASVSDAGLAINDLTTRESDLEDIFLALTSRHDAK